MRKFKLLFGTLAIAAAVVSLYNVLSPGSKVFALSGSEFNPGRIIDDSVFYQPDSMTAGQIQSFLNQEVPTCDTNGTQMYNSTETRAQYGTSQGYPPPYICLKSYTQSTTAQNAISGICSYLPAVSNDSAADIIARVSTACGINPKVLIVLLQKEQGLVTDTWPWSIEYQEATGYGCPDSSGCSSQYYGFFNQVYDAAWQFKEYQANPTNFSYVAGQNNNILYNPNTACGHETVYIQNEATAGLYDYTPYVPDTAALKYVSSSNDGGTGDSCSSYGNRNFWWYYNVWFGSTYGTPFFKLDNTAAIYVLGDNNNYYYVTSPDELYAYGYGNVFHSIDNFPSSYVSGMTNSGNLPLIAKFDSTAPIYLIDSGYAHWFNSQTIYDTYGYGSTQPADLPSWIYDSLYHGSDMAQVVGQNTLPQIYYVQNGKRDYIINPEAYTSLGTPVYSSQPFVRLSDTYVQSLPIGPPIMTEGSVTKAYDTDSYSIWNGSALQPFDAATASDLGLVDYTASSGEINLLPTSGTTVGKLAKDSNGDLYIIDHGQKISVSAGQLANLGLQSSSFVTTDNAFLARLAVKSMPSPTLIRVYNYPQVWLVSSGKLYHIHSYRDFLRMGYSMNNVLGVGQTTYNLFSPTNEELLASGNLIRINNTAPVYFVDYTNVGSFNMWYIPSMDVFYNYGFNMNSVENISSPNGALNGYPNSGDLSTLTKDSSGNVWVISYGVRHVLSSTMQGSSYYNINPANVLGLSDTSLDQIPVGSSMTNLIQVPGSPPVYKVVNGQKEWYTSKAAFVNNGGNWSDISPVSASFSASLPNGPNIN